MIKILIKADSLKVSILSWNINGVKSKFEFAPVIELFLKYDFILISETHFKKREKIPDGFNLVCRSKQINMDYGVGGVAVYRNRLSSYEVDFSHDIFKNSVIFGIKDTDTIIDAIYLPASNSKYFISNPVYFKNLEKMLKCYDNKDMNSRTGTPTSNNRVYINNPDPVINSHGRQLLKLCKENKTCYIVNGLVIDNRYFESKLTFFRGRVSSQNDICISNNPNEIQNFRILDKLVMSDHTPCSLLITINKSTSLHTTKNISAFDFDYSHFDQSNFARKPIKIANVNANNVINDFLELADNLQCDIAENNYNINKLAVKIQDKIYSTCKEHSSKNKHEVIISPNDNRHSKHFNAIAEINFETYKYLLNSNAAEDQISFYAKQ